MGAQVLSATDLTVRFGDVVALGGVSVSVRAGRMLSVTGPSGAGKTTLMHALAGVQEPTSGSVDLDGRRPGQDRVALVPQVHGLAPVLTALESVALPLQAAGAKRGEIEPRARALLEALGLGRHLGHLTMGLSGGQQQRVAVARALAAGADVIVADEPTAELDAENRALVMRLLRAAAEEGRLVVIASDDAQVSALCDDAVGLLDGQLVASDAA